MRLLRSLGSLLAIVYLGVACGSPPRQIALPASSKLVTSDGKENDHFGISVSLDGARAIVGAHGADDRGNQAGAAYVFARAGEGWKQEAKLVAYDGGNNKQFGVSVHLDGDRAIVGSRGDVESGKQSGAAHIFTRRKVGWREEQKLFATGRSKDDRFGTTVRLSGDVAIVGAEGDSQLGSKSGAAYIYRLVKDQRWSVDAVLRPPDSAPFDYYGNSVSVQGDRAAVGARGDDDEGKDSGSVYLYRYTEDGWTMEQKLSPADGCRDGAFGSAVCLDGKRLLVGAYGDNDQGKRSGSAYVYGWDGKRWRFEEKLKAPDGTATDQFGRSLAMDGDRIIVGAHGDQVGGSRRAGSAYVFKRSGTSWIPSAKLTAGRLTSMADFGRSVDILGEAVMVGAPGDPEQGAWSGGAYIFAGK
jgi:hypothetical protein